MLWHFRIFKRIKRPQQNMFVAGCYSFLICTTWPLHILNKTWNMVVNNKFKLVLIFLFIFLTVPWRRFHFHFHSPLKMLKLKFSSRYAEKVVIGMMTCAGGYESTGRGRNETKAMEAASEEPVTLIKSVLISAKIYQATKLEFHIYTDSWLLEETMKKKIDVFRGIMSDFIQTTVHYHNVFDAVPRGHERDFIDNRRKCAYVRCFFPNSLPSTLKEILYLDTDVIVTGNILEIWNNFKEQVVTKADPTRPPQLAALVQNSEVNGNKYVEIYRDNFRWIPHVPPRGVNSGVMFMNLDAMRQFKWTEKIMSIFEEKRFTLMGDQQLINILFHDHLDKLQIFPCQFNFQHLHCEKGLLCTNMTKDPAGIRIMHGAGGMFHSKGRSHIGLYHGFKNVFSYKFHQTNFHLENHEEVIGRLFKPLRKFYSKFYELSNPQGKVTCYGAIGDHLFKEIFS